MNYKGELWSRHAVLAVIMGIRACSLDYMKIIDMPVGESGEEEVAEFCLETAAEYMKESAELEDVNFDEFIETALERRYGHEV